MTNRAGFGDLFWNNDKVFDPANVQPNSAVETMVYWLHDGLHICRNAQGRTRKIVSNGPSILASLPNGRIPTFISEGTSTQNPSAFQRSAYLSQCMTTLRWNADNLVVFRLECGRFSEAGRL